MGLHRIFFAPNFFVSSYANIVTTPQNIWKTDRTLKEKGHLKSNIQMAFLIDLIISSQDQLRSLLSEIFHPFPL